MLWPLTRNQCAEIREIRMIRIMTALFALVAVALAAPSARAQAVDVQKLERNKKNVVEFYNAVLNEKNFDKAATYLGATYIQHNPTAPDGPEGLKGFVNFLRDK